MKQKDILMILIPTFIVTVLWVLFSVYHNYTTSTIKSPLDIQILPIPGTFDMETIAEIKNRQQITPEYNSLEAPDPSVSPSPTPTISPDEEEFIEDDFIDEETLTPTPSIEVSEDEEFIEDDFIDE